VERQLRATQFLLGALAGTVAGAISFGYPGAAAGFFAGLGVAAVGDSVLGGFVGLLLGVVAGLMWAHGRWTAAFLGGLIGVLVGVCLGDWRRFSGAWVNAEPQLWRKTEEASRDLDSRKKAKGRQ
jgi:hypothetical protein